eukprot:6177568-Pleurochrysis_carterae.AAC.2
MRETATGGGQLGALDHEAAPRTRPTQGAEGPRGTQGRRSPRARGLEFVKARRDRQGDVACLAAQTQLVVESIPPHRK